MTELTELIHELIALEAELTTLFVVVAVVVFGFVVVGWVVVLPLHAAAIAPIATTAAVPAVAARRRVESHDLMMASDLWRL